MEAREPHNTTARTHSGVNSELHTSPWHSPVPYLFGGLAAMLGLIAFALLVLACSYWKLLGYNENDGEGGTERDLEAGEGKGEAGRPAMEPKVLVIMAGEKKPTFLATPIGSNGSYYFGDNSEKRCCCSDQKGEEGKQDEKEVCRGGDGGGDGGAETTVTQQSSSDDH
ncbi:hypothetical protein ERO13_A13G211500v2 [Gossypium hirsutum]|uniref:Protein GLUTAMINE DUMPER 2 n=1 Tax=Gossypium hirsutum TaxID=3635 RepID=A0ABM2ZGE4_GOSHI|nr:protein GLUTAMINE DUMPER 2-like [Gossypium hirsutum]KAG4167684.1 hypothetical protein ERO13_A13G211500v2 [Gossypium hirsutum]